MAPTFTKITDLGPIGPKLPEWIFPTVHHHSDATYEGSEAGFTASGRINQTDRMYGNGGNDTLYGNGGVDYLYGGDGNDTLYANGRSMSDYPRAIGTTKLDGGTGDDRLIVTESGVGRFALSGGEGEDRLEVRGVGTMTLSGGADADTFIFGANFEGHAVVTDFQIGTDLLEIRSQGWMTFSEENGNVVIHTPEGGNIELAGISYAGYQANFWTIID